MSRSERMPATRRPSSLTRRAPMPRVLSSRTAAATVVSGGIVATLLPLARKMASTFMAVLRYRGGDGAAPSTLILTWVGPFARQWHDEGQADPHGRHPGPPARRGNGPRRPARENVA